ncbi:MAG TPA: hypothetical protein VGG89_01555 [Candidatus Baltobacteraceae bacterium]
MTRFAADVVPEKDRIAAARGVTLRLRTQGEQLAKGAIDGGSYHCEYLVTRAPVRDVQQVRDERIVVKRVGITKIRQQVTRRALGSFGDVTAIPHRSPWGSIL